MNLFNGIYSVSQNLYQLERCFKYRYNMFRDQKNKKLCEDFLYEVAQRHGIGMIELDVSSDYAHTVVQLLQR